MMKPFAPAPLILALSLAYPAFALDAPPLQAGPEGLAWVGADGRVGIGYDSQTHLRGDVSWVLNEDAASAWLGEGWLSGSAGGIKFGYNWLQGGDSSAVNKAFIALDRNALHDSKLTLGGGREQENLFWGAYLSAGLSGTRLFADTLTTTVNTQQGTAADGRPFAQDFTTTTRTRVFERPYDYGIGARLGHQYDDGMLRLNGGLDYEWGSAGSSQTTLTLGLEKFIRDTPHSVALQFEAYNKRGDFEVTRSDQRIFAMYRYELGGSGYRPLRESRLVQKTAQATDDTAGASAATAGAGAAEQGRMVQTTARMMSDAFFGRDSARLLPDAIAVLDSVIATLKQSGYTGNIHLVGHTCSLGPAAHNMKLSIRRAEAVKRYLAEQGGVAEDRILAEGMGEDQPRYPNTRAMRAKNRRVDLEFVTLGAAGDASAAAGSSDGSAADTGKTPKVEWVREYIEREPAWLRRALHSTVPHKQTVDVYRQQEVTSSTVGGSVNYINRQPLAQGDSFTVNGGQTTLLDVLGNDSDPDQNTLRLLSVSASGNGVAAVSGNQISYTPNEGFTGQDTLTYTVTDDNGGTSTAQVSLTVLSPNHAPFAAYDRFSVPYTRPSILNVLANDSDPDGDPLSILSFSQPGTGSLVLNMDQTLTFTPTNSFATTLFSYTVSDGRGGESTSYVTLIDP